ncbi:MAG: hypothetical protein D8H92_14415, partial [Campylobacter sp.]
KNKIWLKSAFCGAGKFGLYDRYLSALGLNFKNSNPERILFANFKKVKFGTMFAYSVYIVFASKEK